MLIVGGGLKLMIVKERATCSLSSSSSRPLVGRPKKSLRNDGPRAFQPIRLSRGDCKTACRYGLRKCKRNHAAEGCGEPESQRMQSSESSRESRLERVGSLTGGAVSDCDLRMPHVPKYCIIYHITISSFSMSCASLSLLLFPPSSSAIQPPSSPSYLLLFPTSPLSCTQGSTSLALSDCKLDFPY
jgi:hypothetical protein